MQQDKINFNNIKISVEGIEIPTENFDDTNIEIHPEFVPYAFKFESNKKYDHEPETFSVKCDGIEIINKDSSDIKDFTFEFKESQQLNTFEYVIKFEAKYNSETQKLCEKYAVNFY